MLFQKLPISMKPNIIKEKKARQIINELFNENAITKKQKQLLQNFLNKISNVNQLHVETVEYRNI